MRILLVEDNAKLAEWLSRLLRDRNYTIDNAYDGEEAEAAVLVHPYSLIILDLGLPHIGGLDFLRQLRTRGNSTPVLILTASDSVSDRVAGLDAGADDYLAKPFEVEELEARIRAQLRRAHAQLTPVVIAGPIEFDTTTRSFTVDGRQLAFTPRERSVLESLVLRQGIVVAKEALAEAVFGFNDDADPSAIEVYVHRLRRKLGDIGVEIATVRGIGYILRVPNGDRP